MAVFSLILLYKFLLVLSTDFYDQPCFYNQSLDLLNTSDCFLEIKRNAADTQLFWFGDSWKRRCGYKSFGLKRNSIDCFNPVHLRSFTSLGSRLLRVTTFDMAYLRNLHIFPRVTFQMEPNDEPPPPCPYSLTSYLNALSFVTIITHSYMACGHRFIFNEKVSINIRPSMHPVDPFKLHKFPIIDWPDLRKNDKFIVIFIDVGFGRLHYLAYDFPADTKEIRNYRPPVNLGNQPNPLAVVIIRQSKDFILLSNSSFAKDSMFDLQRFMLDNRLQRNLVGLNWVIESVDAYSIEIQRIMRLSGTCHLLIKKRLHEHRELQLAFLPSASLLDLDSWLDVIYQSKATCCSNFTSAIKRKRIRIDPLGDQRLSPTVLQNRPIISIKGPMHAYSYRRRDRNLQKMPKTLMDGKLHALLMVEIESINKNEPHINWLIVDIPTSSLMISSLNEGTELLHYKAPETQSSILNKRFVYILFIQTEKMPIANRFDRNLFIIGNCSYNCIFKVSSFMFRYSLRLKALNWLLADADADEFKDSIVDNRLLICTIPTNCHLVAISSRSVAFIVSHLSFIIICVFQIICFCFPIFVT